MIEPRSTYNPAFPARMSPKEIDDYREAAGVTSRKIKATWQDAIAKRKEAEAELREQEFDKEVSRYFEGL